jgi:MFS family permease
MSTNESAQMPQTKKGMPYWWKAVIAFTLGWMILNANKYFLNPILPSIADTYGLNNTQLGMVNSVFFFTYTFAQIPSGAFGDKFGKKRLIVIGLLFYGLFTGVSGLMAGFTGFMVARALAGLASSTYYGPQFALSAEAIPLKKRTLGSAIINSGAGIGTALGFIVSSTLVLSWGYNWQFSFLFFGILTLIIGFIIHMLVKDDRKEMKEKQEEKVMETEIEKPKVSALSLLKNRNLLVVFLVLFCSIYGFTVVVTWLPMYLETERGFAGSQVGLISALVPLVAIPSALLFSHFVDKTGKKKPFAYFLIPAAAIALWAIVYFESIIVMLAALVVYGIFGKLALDPMLIAAVSENADPEVYGVAYSMYNMIGMLSSVIAPWFTGLLADITGSMAAGFYSAVIVLGVGLILIMFLRETPKTKEAV